MLSFAAPAVESIAVFAESAALVTVCAAESVVVSELELPLQAANEPIANTTKSFFIVMCFL
jgi:hypothetical protein